jgi:hypothetical protein
MRPLLLGEIVQDNYKPVFYASFFPFGGHLGTPKWTQKSFPKVLKCVGHMAQCLNLEISP